MKSKQLTPPTACYRRAVHCGNAMQLYRASQRNQLFFAFCLNAFDFSTFLKQKKLRYQYISVFMTALLEEGNRVKRATQCGGRRVVWVNGKRKFRMCVCGCCARVCAVFANLRYTWYFKGKYYTCVYRIHFSYWFSYQSLKNNNCWYGRRRYFRP